VEREQVAETLSGIDILLEDIEWHAKRVRKEIDKFLEHIDKDSERLFCHLLAAEAGFSNAL